LYSTAKLSADHVVNFPDLCGLIQNAEKLDQEKAVMFLYPRFEKQIVKRMPLKGIFMPRIADQDDTRLTAGSLSTTERAISFTTMSLLPYAGRHTHDFICRLSSILPGYTLELGKDLKKIPFAVSGFLNDLPNHKTYDANYPGTVHATIESETKPLVSVIIPVFNGEQFIKDAVDNILSQDYPALELIIVNDGSTDRTEEIIKGLPCDIRYFKQTNEGPASARNRGIKNASGELIMFLDVDDLWPENNLHMLVNEMLSEPDIDVIRGSAQLMKYNSEINDYEYIGNTKDSFPYSITAAIYRKSVFTKVGLFDRLTFGEDMDWFYRAIELKVKIKRLEDVTLIVRKHGKNMTRGKSVVELNMLRVVKKHLDRVRVQEIRSKRGIK
ncbi:MAG: glycosyltransferase family 2 protein, partial [Thermodesulfobacteriota bacterium]